MQLQIYKTISNNICTKIVFVKFLKNIYKIKTTTIFFPFIRLIIKHFLLNLTSKQFCLLQYNTNSTNLYIKNSFFLIKLFFKL